jgi:hypothetical protein
MRKFILAGVVCMLLLVGGGGYFVRIEYDTGVRCVTAPCPMATDSTNLFGWLSRGFPRAYSFSFFKPE